jgi:thioredoxin-related protein
MRRQLCLGTLLVSFLALGCRPAAPVVTYSVDVYDPTRDPIADLAATMAQAKSSGKRILVQVGGDWCSWCHRLDAFIKSEPALAQALGENFVLMKVNYSDANHNEAFLSQYPEISGYPHWFVLDADGKLIHSQDTAELEAGESYNRPAILMFIDQWKTGAGGA